jgi:cupin superfamily acireductone dioxygenase involved in methionine salvage
MCILVDQSGKIFANENSINQLLSPVQAGNFVISNEAKKFTNREMNESNANRLFDFIPQDMLAFCEDKKLIQTKASIFKKSAEQVSQSRSDASQIPHINSGNEVHFFFDGSYIIYFNVNDQHYSLIVQAGDWLFIPADVEHWIKGTEDHYLVIVSYHSEPFETFHSKVNYTNTKSKSFL